ncbi:MAG: signal peptidase I [Myxococcota bacterium]
MSPGARELPEATASGGRAGEAWRTLRTVAWALFLATVIRETIFETYYVPSESMLPTLLIGDHMIVDKLRYGVRIPFTNARATSGRDPERGDVVIFWIGRKGPADVCPVDRCPGWPREGFVKRIVGVPGDTIEVRGGRVILNGERLPTSFGSETFEDDAGVPLLLGREALGASTHAVLDHPHHEGTEQVHITVPDGRYFVMGDNRDNSNDSRSWGTVRREDLVGRVTHTYWSWNNRESWLAMLNPFTWWRLLTSETRWERIGQRVE